GPLGDESAPTPWPVDEGGNGHLYQWVEVPAGVSWIEAQAVAEFRGGHLATPTSEAENTFIFDLIAGVDALWQTQTFASGATVTFGPWIGGLQDPAGAEPDGGWGWVTGELWDYTNWRDIEPNQNNEQFGVDEDFLHYAGPGAEPSDEWNDRNVDPFDGTLPDEFGPQVTGFVIEYVPAPGGLGVACVLLGLGVSVRRMR
ncbi:MAG: hypothetical protein AAGH64_10520, partial [Planctomycetota bacterium]